MKKFKVEGWYRLQDSKDFEELILYSENTKNAINYFKFYFGLQFYKITAKEI